MKKDKFLKDKAFELYKHQNFEKVVDLKQAEDILIQMWEKEDLQQKEQFQKIS